MAKKGLLAKRERDREAVHLMAQKKKFIKRSKSLYGLDPMVEKNSCDESDQMANMHR